MTPKERVALLQKLAAGVDIMPTDEAREAIRYLKSMEKYQPKTHPEGWQMRISNPVVGVKPGSSDHGRYASFGFSTDTGMERPESPRSRLQTNAIKAVNAQLLDAMPSAKQRIPGNTLPSKIEFGAVYDDKDYLLERKRGKPTNQRAAAYKRFTNGAFQAYPETSQAFSGPMDWTGYTEKIDSNTWQPRSPQGRFMKHVKWDPKDTLKPLAIAAGQRVLRSFPLTQGFATMLEIDSIVEGVTGTSPIKSIAGIAKDNIKKDLVPKPITLIKPPF